MTPLGISKKLKTFAHSEFSSDKFSDPKIIEKKIESKEDLFERGHEYIKIKLDVSFPEYIVKNKLNYSQWII